MEVLDKIISWFSGNSSGDKIVEDIPAKENSISSQDSLIRIIERILKRNYKGSDFTFDDRILRLWVTDSVKYDSLKDSGFRKDLIIYLDGQIGAIFADVEICRGPLPDNNDFTRVDDGIFMEVCKPVQHACVTKAVITVLSNYGSLIHERCELDSSKIEELPAQRYNIGAGEYPDVPGRFRCNQIAINDSLESPEYERNKYVSRTHAYIRYSADNGFMLQAEPEGTVLGGKRTRILRTDNIIDVDDMVPQPLKNGDCIELNKTVRLLFTVIS